MTRFLFILCLTDYQIFSGNNISPPFFILLFVSVFFFQTVEFCLVVDIKTSETLRMFRWFYFLVTYVVIQSVRANINFSPSPSSLSYSRWLQNIDCLWRMLTVVDVDCSWKMMNVENVDWVKKKMLIVCGKCWLVRGKCWLFVDVAEHLFLFSSFCISFFPVAEYVLDNSFVN